MARFKLHIYGKVQGVYYRQSAQETARSLGLTGWVKNLGDGTVMVEAAGTVSQLEAFLSWCKQGPVRARVDSIEVSWLTKNTESDDILLNQGQGFAIID